MSVVDSFLQRIRQKKAQKTTQKEEFANSQDFLRSLLAGNVRGFKNKFVSDIYKERVLFPHEEMEIARKAFRYNSYVASAVRTRGNFMTGGRIEVVSDDEAWADKVNSLLKKTRLSTYPQFVGVDLVNVGNFYCERIYEGGKIVGYEYIAHPERMYMNLDEYGLIKGYFQEIPEVSTGGNNFKTLRYYGDRRKTIKGIEIDKNKIFHMKIGAAEIPQYGRGFVACVINDVEILLEIERSIAIISRYKAIPKKLISLNRGEDPSGGKAAEWYANQLNNLSDDEIAVLPEEINATDLSYSGKELNFAPIVDYLKKKITVALAPSFIMHGEETNYAVSRDQKEAFILQVNAERETVENQLKKEVSLLVGSYGMKVPEFRIQFGEFDLGQTQDRLEYARGAFSSNLITLNEARELIGFPEDDELGEMYFTEMGANSALLGLGSNGEEEETGTSFSSDSKNTPQT